MAERLSDNSSLSAEQKMDAKPSRLSILAGIFPTNMAVFSQATNSPLRMYVGNGKIICTSTPPMALKAAIQPAFGGQGVHFRHDEKRNSQKTYYTMITIVCHGLKKNCNPFEGRIFKGGLR